MLIYLIVRWLVNALLLMLVPYIVTSVEIRSFYTALVTALVLGLVNAVIRPILILLTLPVNILTLGLFTLVINGLMFWFVASFVKGFEIPGFWAAFWAALVYSILSAIVNFFLKEKPKTV